MGSCCGRGGAKPVSGGRKTVYVVTWGNGETHWYSTLPAARVAMATQSDPARKRGMYVVSRQVTN